MFDKEEIIDYGDSGILIKFSDIFNEKLWEKTHLFSNEFKKRQIIGILSVVPTLTSVFIHFNLLETNRYYLKKIITDILEKEDWKNNNLNSKKYRIPVVFGGDYGPDIDDVKAESGKTEKELIEQFTSKPHRILCISRGPMMSSPINQKIKRNASPRQSIPAGTLNAAYNQIGISWVSAPSGWKSIGQTPAILFD